MKPSISARAAAVLACTLGAISVGASPAAWAEEVVAVSDLPAPVVSAIQQRWPGARIRVAERERDNNREVYEIEVAVGADDRELTVTADGQILRVDD